jgi:hypothetical protein
MLHLKQIMWARVIGAFLVTFLAIYTPSVVSAFSGIGPDDVVTFSALGKLFAEPIAKAGMDALMVAGGVLIRGHRDPEPQEGDN